jgi:hypothetical protein
MKVARTLSAGGCWKSAFFFKVTRRLPTLLAMCPRRRKFWKLPRTLAVHYCLLPHDS